MSCIISRRTLTRFANSGQPAKSATASSTSANTCAVESRREAKTILAERADVKESEEDRLYQLCLVRRTFSPAPLPRQALSAQASSLYPSFLFPFDAASVVVDLGRS